MEPTHVVCFVAGAMLVLLIIFVVRLLRQKEGDPHANSPVAVGGKPSSPLPPAGEVPYGVDQRPVPVGEELDVLLPVQVGWFVRALNRVPKDIHDNPIYADYRGGNSGVFMELGICSEPSGAQQAILTAKMETDAGNSDPPQHCSLATEPSYLLRIDRRGAFFAWTRGSYYFSVAAQGGEADLDAFMQAFPY